MFVRGLLGNFPASILQAVVGVLTILVFTRLLSSTEFGIYALAFSVCSLAHVLVFTWLEAAMARYWAGEATPEGLADLYATLYRVGLVLSLVFIPAAIAVCLLLPLGMEIRLAMAVGLIGVPIRCLLNMVKVALRARGAVRQAAGLDIFFTLAVFILGIAAAWLGLGGASPLVGLLVAPLLALPIALPLERGKQRHGRYNPSRLKAYIAYGYPISMSLSMALILASTDRFMLAWLMNEAAVGAYHASYSIANRTLDIIFLWLGTAGAPALVMALEKGGARALKIAAEDQARILMLVTVPAAVGVALVARPLAEVVIGPELRTASAMVTPWIAASAFLSGWLYYYFNQAFTLSKRTLLLLMSMIIPAIANIALNIILIPKLGLMGAAISTVLGYFIGVLASVIMARRIMTMPLPWKDVMLCSLCAATMAIAVLCLPQIGGFAELMLDAVVGALVYGVLAYGTNAGGVRDLLKRIRDLRLNPEEQAL
ncbi:polysaccharide biosynthesis protein HsfF [Brevundimonas terrae]|uniref:Polysaccharide biosynthesis protein HsfF n=1 Tax=Brevundimonas terrae TaxID=363631 RepID=A0ABN0YG85_9CAUL|nr:polysaccharide biosynthesis C-terminal domain-containing protein [Brevundimonas terrae]